MQTALDATQAEDILLKAAMSYHIACDALAKLQKIQDAGCFQSLHEEINFYKCDKPLIQKEVIYYGELYHLESQKPQESSEAIENYYHSVLKANAHYFNRHRTFYNYYRTQGTHLDKMLFTLQGQSTELPVSTPIIADSTTGPKYSFVLARIQALERLSHYINNEIAKLSIRQLDKSDSLIWTDSKASLVELLYALHNKGAFNNGNVSLKTVIATVETMFSINLSGYHIIYNQNIKIRRKNRTAYLQLLIDRFIDKMNQQDQPSRE